MTKTWVIADLHFGHKNICKFLRDDGTKLRPWDDVHEMDKDLVNNWNALVNDEDRVYVLGDLSMDRKSIHVIGECKGRKVLVKGNHDIFKLKDYAPYFDDIRACVTYTHQAILSHIPIHPGSLDRWNVNIHGHTHSNNVLDKEGVPDKRYVCVSVEQTGFKPVLLDDILKQFK